MSSNNNHLYRDRWTRIDTVLGEISFLAKLARAKAEYDKTHNNGLDQFIDWLYNTYGITVATQGENLTAEYEIHDEQKFLMFVLKFG